MCTWAVAGDNADSDPSYAKPEAADNASFWVQMVPGSTEPSSVMGLTKSYFQV